MADIVRGQGENIPIDMQTRYKDMEDNTHAPVVAAVLVGVPEAGSDSQILLTDETTNALAIIPVVHHEVHEGKTFQTSYKTPDASPLADDAALNFLLITGSLFSHLTFAGAAGGDAEILLYEDTQYSASGAALPEWNMKRTSSSGTTLVMSLGPTITNVGTLLHNCFLPGGTGGNAPGGIVREDTEWILRPNSVYMVRLINRAGNAQPASLVAQWYEKETD